MYYRRSRKGKRRSTANENRVFPGMDVAVKTRFSKADVNFSHLFLTLRSSG